VSGLVIAAVVTLVIFLNGMTEAKDLVAIAGAFTGITGTLVGTLLGAHVGGAGKMQLQADRDSAVRMRAEAMAMLSDDDREKVKRRATAAE
jgi:flagellar motor component MotA